MKLRAREDLTAEQVDSQVLGSACESALSGDKNGFT